jgi:hypothetical protein
VERFNLKNLNNGEIEEQYQVKICNLDDDDDNVGISRTWKSISDNIKASATESLGYYGLRQLKPWFDEECSKFLGQRKKSKLQ